MPPTLTGSGAATKAVLWTSIELVPPGLQLLKGLG